MGGICFNTLAGVLYLASWTLWVAAVLVHVGGHAMLMLWPLLCPHQYVTHAGKMHRAGIVVAVVGASLLLSSGTDSLQQFQTQLILSGAMLVVQQVRFQLGSSFGSRMWEIL